MTIFRNFELENIALINKKKCEYLMFAVLRQDKFSHFLVLLRQNWIHSGSGATATAVNPVD